MRGERAGDALVVRGPGLEPVVRGPDLVGGQAVEDVGLAVQHADVRAKPLVGRAGEEVRVEGADVDRAVGGVGDRVDERQGADFMRARDDLTDRIDRADRVAGVAHRDELRPRAELRFEVLEVEGHVGSWMSTVWTVTLDRPPSPARSRRWPRGRGGSRRSRRRARQRRPIERPMWSVERRHVRRRT